MDTNMSVKSFEFQGLNYSRMIDWWYKLTIIMDTVPISCGIALKMIGSATRYEW